MRKIIYIMLVLLCLVGCGNSSVTAPVYNDELEPADEVSVFVLITNIDEVNEKITLRAVNYDTKLVLQYNGGTDVKDKYGNILAMSQVELGAVADIVYDANRDKLLSLHISGNDKVQQMKQVSGAEINLADHEMKMNDRIYKLSDSVSAFSDNKEIGLDEICSEDQLTVWVYNEKICSIYVELGHGYVRLTDYSSYIGGMIEIGYDVIVPVTEDMLLTVREGEYTLRIAKGDDVGTKYVKVKKNQEMEISLADIAIEPKQTGSVLFRLTPSNAAVYIDGRKVNTEGAVEIVYGKHKIFITAKGYQSYSASFNVNYAYKIKEYTLQPEDSTTTEQSTTEKKSESATTQSSEDKSTQSTTENATTESTTKDVTATTGTKTNNKVTIVAPIGASVYFDGEYIGIAPMSFTKVTGSHILTLSMSGYLSKSYTVTFADDGKDETLRYEELTSITSLIE